MYYIGSTTRKKLIASVESYLITSHIETVLTKGEKGRAVKTEREGDGRVKTSDKEGGREGLKSENEREREGWKNENERERERRERERESKGMEE